MKEIDLKDIGNHTGRLIRMEFEGQIVTVRVMLSMGPMYFLIKDQKMIAHVYEGKTSIPTTLYEL